MAKKGQKVKKNYISLGFVQLDRATSAQVKLVAQDQCDQKWQNFATLATF